MNIGNYWSLYVTMNRRSYRPLPGCVVLSPSVHRTRRRRCCKRLLEHVQLGLPNLFDPKNLKLKTRSPNLLAGHFQPYDVDPNPPPTISRGCQWLCTLYDFRASKGIQSIKGSDLERGVQSSGCWNQSAWPCTTSVLQVPYNNYLYYFGGVPYYTYGIMGPKTLF